MMYYLKIRIVKIENERKIFVQLILLSIYQLFPMFGLAIPMKTTVNTENI